MGWLRTGVIVFSQHLLVGYCVPGIRDTMVSKADRLAGVQN